MTAPGHDLACVVHVHSRCSDGTATVPEIAAAAGRAGAGAVLLTDHDTLAGRRWSGWHGEVLVMVGLEVSPSHGHLLAFGLDAPVAHEGMTQRQIAAAVADAGGLGFPAHPFSRGSRISTAIGRPHGWHAFDAPYTGIEVWSAVTDAAERCSSVRELWSLVRDPVGAIDQPEPRALAAWDALGRSRRVPGIGGLDAHQSGLRVAGRVLSPFPNARLFGTVRTHLLLARAPEGDAVRDEALVLEALAAGRAYIALESVAPAAGFSFEAEHDGGSVAMGEEIPARRCRLAARAPASAELRLLRDGRCVAARSGDRVEATVEEPGVYRCEARRGDRAWILSNPVYLR